MSVCKITKYLQLRCWCIIHRVATNPLTLIRFRSEYLNRCEVATISGGGGNARQSPFSRVYPCYPCYPCFTPVEVNAGFAALGEVSGCCSPAATVANNRRFFFVAHTSTPPLCFSCHLQIMSPKSSFGSEA